MIELILAIAALCNVAPSKYSYTYSELDRLQLLCQQGYLLCIDDVSGIHSRPVALRKCIFKRGEGE